MTPKEKPALADHHTHTQDVEFHHPESAKAFGIKVGDHLYPNVSNEKYVTHVLSNNLDTIWMIYEDIKRFQLIKKDIRQTKPECTVNGFYYIRDPRNFDEAAVIQLHKKGLLQGIKLHPVIDHYELLPENVDKAMVLAEKLNVPVIYHSDDRRESMHLTSPENQLALAAHYPNVRLVIGHGGAYANPRLVGKRNTGAISYWRTRGKDLIIAALRLAESKKNVFYETSVVTNTIKAALIAEFVEADPHMALKILAGSDFPVIGARLDSQIAALEKAGLSPQLVSQIAANRL